MDIKEFLRLINAYKWMVLAITVATLFITYLFVKNLPKEYKSQAKMSTGLLDPSRQVAPDVPNYSGPDLLIKINQQFTNIMDIMTMPKNISVLSYRLILHDLEHPQKAFKTLSNDVLALTPAKRQEAIEAIKIRLNKQQVLTPLDNGQVQVYNLIKSMGYDGETLGRQLDITHQENSDFITVEFTSQNTFLSVFVVNTLCSDFINNYSNDLISNKNISINVLDSLLKRTEAMMVQKNQALRDYKIKKGVLNLDKQSQIIYQQIGDYEDKKSQALRDIQSLQSAISNIGDKLSGGGNEVYLGSELRPNNQQIINLKSQIQAANNAYVDNGFRPADKKKADSLQQLLNAQLLRTNDAYINDPLMAKQSLVQQRIDLEIALDKARGSVANINAELAKLNNKFATMVPFDADVQNLERDADVATKEYLDILNRYNQTNLDKNIGLRLRVEQEGVPSGPERSKKMLFMALAGIASLAICFAILFLIYALDHAIYNSKQLEQATKNKVIGKLNFIKKENRNINEVWKQADEHKDYQRYKNLLRAVRFEINESLSLNDKVLGVTSLHPEENKVFSALSMAYAFARMGKSVLVIGDDEMANDVAQLNIPVNQTFKTMFNTGVFQKNDHITFLNSDLNGLSLLENNDKHAVAKVFDALKAEFDLIVVYLDGLNTVSEIKEWLLFTNKYVATFKAGNTISATDKESIRFLRGEEKFLGWIMSGVKRN